VFSRDRRSLPGRPMTEQLPTMNKPRIAFIGAGSVVFSKNVLSDILWHDALKDADIRLVDIDGDRLNTAEGMLRKVNSELGGRAAISATRDRRRALDGADFVINCIGVGGYAATKVDLQLPLKFGVKQTVGDTLGVGGIFRSIRSIPELLGVCADMAGLCPDALLLNYSNPMAMHCLAVERATAIRHVGLCHGVQGTAQTMRMLTEMLREPPAAIARHFARPWGDATRDAEWKNWMERGLDPDLSYTCAGINHMAFFLRFESKGRDLYPLLRRAFGLPHVLRIDPVRFELFRRLGYFMTETSGHTAEYVPYFMKDPKEIEARHIWVNSYVHTCKDQDQAYRALRRTVRAGRPILEPGFRLSKEYASKIVNAVVTGRPFVFNGNVHNRGGALISNLPGDSCVEVPCVADRQGVRPTAVGELPPQCAALIRPNVSVQDLTVRGILEGRRDRILQAVMMDPNTASQISLPQLDKLVDAMFRAHAKRLPKGLR
jgi:alpha-galactosidase